MDQKTLETYCKQNGVPFHFVGDQLRVMDLTQMPQHMRKTFDIRGFYVAEEEEIVTVAAKPKGKAK